MRKRIWGYGSLFVFLFLALSLVRPYRVSDISMNYSLIDGDLVWVENLTAGIHVPSWGFYIDRHLWSREEGIHRGDILAFRHPLDRRLYLKRCVALPGDRLFEKHKDFYLQIGGDSARTAEYADRFGLERVSIDGEWWLKNPYTRFYSVVHNARVVGPRELIDYPVTTVPPHRYFMMGDYRDNSTDSRFFGPVPYDFIYYRVFAVWQKSRSLEELGAIRQLELPAPDASAVKY
ncbi:signal peptidase I [Nitratifractor sp.]